MFDIRYGWAVSALDAFSKASQKDRSRFWRKISIIKEWEVYRQRC